MMTHADFIRGCDHLCQVDSQLERIINHYGTDQMPTRRSSAMRCLAQSIVGQQISTKAAESVWARLLAELGSECTPKSILECNQTALRGAGLSERKTQYLRNIALFLSSAPLDSHPDIRAALLAVKGIGPWTYNMFAIFYLLEPDILPLGDLGLIRSMEQLYFNGEPTAQAELAQHAETWRPYRTIATWYLWRQIDDDIIQY